jgi:nucleoside-diphosphate-sugar epimerase
MARVLIVGCGCRGRSLAATLAIDGHAVRGTTRGAGVAQIEAIGAEAAVADPDRLGTVTGLLGDVSAICWLMGGAAGPTATDVNGPRLESLLERLVDTPVRGIVYEAAGSADAQLLDRGAAAVRAAAARWRMPAEVVDADPGYHPGWLAAMRAAVGRLL